MVNNWLSARRAPRVKGFVTAATVSVMTIPSGQASFPQVPFWYRVIGMGAFDVRAILLGDVFHYVLPANCVRLSRPYCHICVYGRMHSGIQLHSYKAGRVLGPYNI